MRHSTDENLSEGVQHSAGPCTVPTEPATEGLIFFFSVGNKNDDPAKKKVETQDAVRFGESVGVRVFETSAKDNINVEEVRRLPRLCPSVHPSVSLSFSPALSSY